ncbi:MAG: hypothetical protein FLDDKLPJ_02883 [Phycisphaerae bacterium]|nr:hypothetical protein [Phycisphaerae bacterium]
MGPSWEQVKFAVGCPRCGVDLRGQGEPVCPRCDLAFQWSDLIPREGLRCPSCTYDLFGLSELRCPECGDPFTWDGLLRAHDERERSEFEFRWRRQPIRSYVRTIRRTLRPGRFWRGIALHHDPRPWALVAYVAATWGYFALILLVALSVVSTLSSVTLALVGVTAFPRLFLSSLASHVRFPEFLVLLVMAGTWCAASLGSLFVLEQSMQKVRVRRAHLFRIWAYCVPTLLPVAAVAGAAILYAGESLGWRLRGALRELPVWMGVPAMLVVLSTVYALRQAFTHYLKLPHGGAIGVLTQVVAVLAAFLAADLMMPAFTGRFFLDLASVLGIRI